VSDYTNPGDTPQSDYDKAEIRRLRAELEKARGERDEARNLADLRLDLMHKQEGAFAQRDSARALLRECVPELRICNADLRDRITKELGE
jgi:hypothetical protein